MPPGEKLTLKKNMQTILIWNKEAWATLLGTVSSSLSPRDGADIGHGRRAPPFSKLRPRGQKGPSLREPRNLRGGGVAMERKGGRQAEARISGCARGPWGRCDPTGKGPEAVHTPRGSGGRRGLRTSAGAGRGRPQRRSAGLGMSASARSGSPGRSPPCTPRPGPRPCPRLRCRWPEPSLPRIIIARSNSEMNGQTQRSPCATPRGAASTSLVLRDARPVLLEAGLTFPRNPGEMSH